MGGSNKKKNRLQAAHLLSSSPKEDDDLVTWAVEVVSSKAATSIQSPSSSSTEEDDETRQEFGLSFGSLPDSCEIARRKRTLVTKEGDEAAISPIQSNRLRHIAPLSAQLRGRISKAVQGSTGHGCNIETLSNLEVSVRKQYEELRLGSPILNLPSRFEDFLEGIKQAQAISNPSQTEDGDSITHDKLGLCNNGVAAQVHGCLSKQKPIEDDEGGGKTHAPMGAKGSGNGWWSHKVEDSKVNDTDSYTPVSSHVSMTTLGSKSTLLNECDIPIIPGALSQNDVDEVSLPYALHTEVASMVCCLDNIPAHDGPHVASNAWGDGNSLHVGRESVKTSHVAAHLIDSFSLKSDQKVVVLNEVEKHGPVVGCKLNNFVDRKHDFGAVHVDPAVHSIKIEVTKNSKDSGVGFMVGPSTPSVAASRLGLVQNGADVFLEPTIAAAPTSDSHANTVHFEDKSNTSKVGRTCEHMSKVTTSDSTFAAGDLFGSIGAAKNKSGTTSDTFYIPDRVNSCGAGCKDSQAIESTVAASRLGNNSLLMHNGADVLFEPSFEAPDQRGTQVLVEMDHATSVFVDAFVDSNINVGGLPCHLDVDNATCNKYAEFGSNSHVVAPCGMFEQPTSPAFVVGPAADEVPLPSVLPHRTAQAIGSWADLVKPPVYSNGLKLEFVDLSACRKELKLTIPKAVTEIGCHEWENTLVGIFLDRKLPFSLVHRVTSGFWGNVGLTEILATDHGVFYFRFSSLPELEKVLEGGPWNVAGKPIMLRKWEPQGSYRKDRITKVPVWVHLYNIPLEYWTSEGLSYIASMVGRPIHTDRMTASRKRITYARICVEVDASQEWIKSFEVEAESSPSSNPITIHVEYQWTPSRCSKCICFGHDCSKQPLTIHTTSRPDTRDTKHKWKLVKNAQKDSNTKAQSSSGKPVEGQWAEIPSKEDFKGKGKIDDNIKGPRCTVDEEGVKITNCYLGDGPSSSAGTPPMEEDSIVSTIVPSFVPIEHSSGPRGKNVTAQVLPTNNRFHALPSANEVGAAMEHTEAGQETFTDIDCDEETEEYNDVVTCGPSTPASPPSSRQRKKNAKMKHSGSRPKGRHRS